MAKLGYWKIEVCYVLTSQPTITVYIGYRFKLQKYSTTILMYNPTGKRRGCTLVANGFAEGDRYLKASYSILVSLRGRAFGTKWGISHTAILSLSSYSLWLSLQDDKMPIFGYLSAASWSQRLPWTYRLLLSMSWKFQASAWPPWWNYWISGDCSSQRTQRHSVITSLTFSLVLVRWRYRTMFLHGSTLSKKAIFHSHILPCPLLKCDTDLKDRLRSWEGGQRFSSILLTDVSQCLT